MDGWQLGAALLSALLHAAWNAAVKASASPREAMTAQMVASALIGAVPLLLLGLPAPAAWPWVAVTTALNMLAVRAMLRAYDSGGFGTVYPLVRASAVLGVAAAAPWAIGERIGALAVAGIGCIATALVMLALDARRHVAPAGAGSTSPAASMPAFPAAAMGWTLLAGLTTAGYVLTDARGVRAAGDMLAYGCAVSVTNAVAMSWLMRSAGSPQRLLRRHWRVAAPAALASMASYLLILWVVQHAPVALAAALRDTSALFALVIAVVWLKEPLPPRRLAALGLALAGVPLLRLG
jgi:drug/metabolite transporter (DMT)-like permease